MKNRPRPTAIPRVAAITAYKVPRHGAPIDLPLDGNEGPVAALDVTGVLGDVTSLVNRYPSARELQERWAARLGIDAARVRITAGADEALDRIVRTFVGPGRDMLATDPTFEMLARYCALAGGRYVTVPWVSGAFPADEMRSRITSRTSLIAVVSPNNPTGAVATIDNVRRLAEAAPRAVVLVDLAYAEFADVDPVSEVLAIPNALVTRTLSKAWGLAGLRVGCAAGPGDLIACLAAAGNPYPVSGLSIALATLALEQDNTRLDAAVAQIRNERAELTRLLSELGADPLPSQANFVFARFGDARWLWDGLSGLGIAVRRFEKRAGLEQAIRIACPGNQNAFDRLVRALRAVLKPEALLFDLDGVLADVSASFPEAVRATAAAYGVEVTRTDIVRAKAAGGANNDWLLTQRLMLERGVARPLDEVTEAFERFYQGSGGAPGLCETERCVVTRAWLERLASKYPLAIVTGRPRDDAERFLDRAAIRSVFKTLVTMNDGPAKPDPAPVVLALERLGVRSAWMVGDTPDDVRAARAAGVVPLGIVAPGADATLMGPALRQAGAARLVSRLEEIYEVLP